MKANLEWINREWNTWKQTGPGKAHTPYHAYDLQTEFEHTAKLFAAHCMDALMKQAAPTVCRDIDIDDGA
jgi:hypothetical protein